MQHIFSLFAISFFFIHTSLSARTKLTPEEYCETYAGLARAEMRNYGIPASITLAQGILESACGSSTLAIEGNNHFGIKAAGTGWKGPVIYRDDDKKNEAFIKFSSVAEGYAYHSTFLLRPHYKVLFTYDIHDYKSWARGLKECGYATNSKYATLLIDIIERYNLTAYDVSDDVILTAERKVFVTSAKNGLFYIRCLLNDDISAIAKEFGFKVHKLRYWNDLTTNSVLHEGDIIYLQNKKSKYKDRDTHTVRPGDSMWSISQMYGIHVNSLMKRNKLVSATVHAGQVLRLH